MPAAKAQSPPLSSWISHLHHAIFNRYFDRQALKTSVFIKLCQVSSLSAPKNIRGQKFFNFIMEVNMSHVEMGKFRYGASEFMSYWLPMILFMGNSEETKHIAYMMVFKYRNAYLTKEEAESVSKRELDEILRSVSQITDYALKAAQIIESLKSRHYYPEPQYFPAWEKEWHVNLTKQKYN